MSQQSLLSAEVINQLFASSYNALMTASFSEGSSRVWESHLSDVQRQAFHELRDFFRSSEGNTLCLATTLRGVRMCFYGYAAEFHPNPMQQTEFSMSGRGCAMRSGDAPWVSVSMLEILKRCTDDAAVRMVTEVRRMAAFIVNPKAVLVPSVLSSFASDTVPRRRARRVRCVSIPRRMQRTRKGDNIKPRSL